MRNAGSLVAKNCTDLETSIGTQESKIRDLSTGLDRSFIERVGQAQMKNPPHCSQNAVCNLLSPRGSGTAFRSRHAFMSSRFRAKILLVFYMPFVGALSR